MDTLWTKPIKPAMHAEQALITAILDGVYPAGASLPAERELARQLGVTRPTLREALQRLERDGWVTIRHGKPTQVNDIWREGGLNALSALVHYSANLPPDFVTNLLELRKVLAPAYIRAAVANAPTTVADLLAQADTLEDSAAAFANFDWQLHRALSIASGNPIFTMVLNGFSGFYEELARRYFTSPVAREVSRQFYSALADAASRQDPDEAERVARQVMERSIELWQSTGGALS